MTDADKISYATKLMADRREAVNRLDACRDKDRIDALLKSIESLDHIIISVFHPATVPYQLCPKCCGDGNLNRFNSPQSSSSLHLTCDVCHGNKIIPQFIIPNQPKA